MKNLYLILTVLVLLLLTFGCIMNRANDSIPSPLSIHPDSSPTFVSLDREERLVHRYFEFVHLNDNASILKIVDVEPGITPEVNKTTPPGTKVQNVSTRPIRREQLRFITETNPKLIRDKKLSYRIVDSISTPEGVKVSVELVSSDSGRYSNREVFLLKEIDDRRLVIHSISLDF